MYIYIFQFQISFPFLFLVWFDLMVAVALTQIVETDFNQIIEDHIDVVSMINKVKFNC